MFGVTAQHPGAQGVERAEPEALRGFAEDGGDAFAHLPRRLVGEGDGQDLVGEGAPGQQDMGEAGGQHAGLAGAGAGQDQQRAIDGLDGGALFGVQAGQVVGGEGRFGRHKDDIDPGARTWPNSARTLGAAMTVASSDAGGDRLCQPVAAVSSVHPARSVVSMAR